MSGNLVTVVRDTGLVNIDEASLQKDDVVVLQAGDIVPADLKLVESRALEIDEFELTGEILPVVKKVQDDDVILYRGSRILKGEGEGIVFATGDETEYGKILAQECERSRPYEFRIFKKQYLALVGLLLPAFVLHITHSNQDGAVIALYLSLAVLFIFLQNTELFKYLLISIENKKLRRGNIQVRDERALELMHQVDIICYDKTGVLTTRQMGVQNIYFSDVLSTAGNGLNHHDEHTTDLILLACALCHDVYHIEKMYMANPIDRALITFAQQNGMNVNQLLHHFHRIYDKPFDAENRYMACGFEADGKEFYFAKGDPGVIYRKRCSDQEAK